MSKRKVTNSAQVSTGAADERKSESTRCRETLAVLYAAEAEAKFVGVAVKTFHKSDTEFVSEEDVRETLKKVYGAPGLVWVYTQPSDQTSVTSDLIEVPKSWNRVLPIGRRWFRKEVAVTDAFVLLRAYSNYLRFKEDGDKALLRSAKKIVSEMTQEEMIAFVLEARRKAQQTTDTQTDNNGKQD